MEYRQSIAKSVARTLNRLDERTRRRIRAAIDQVAANPRAPNNNVQALRTGAIACEWPIGVCSTTSTELAAAADISNSQLSAIENGESSGSVAALRRMANILHVTVDDLLS